MPPYFKRLSTESEKIIARTYLDGGLQTRPSRLRARHQLRL